MNEHRSGKLYQFLMEEPRECSQSLGVIMVAGIGVVDYFTGFYLSFSIFYLIPVAFCSWFAGKKEGIIISLAGALTWILADILAGHQYPSIYIPMWNTAIRLGIFLLVSRLISQVKIDLEHERQLARQDFLTGLLNSRAFYEVVEIEIQRSRRNSRPLTLAYIDLDNFKSVNDSAGHVVGDRLLTSVARIMKKEVRAVDFMARLGGDEFVLLMSETDQIAARGVVDRLHQKLNAMLAGEKFAVTISIGVVTWEVAPDSASEIVHAADDLMYDVKSDGKNKVYYQLRKNDDRAIA